ncbi:hypothetical protein MPSEU_000131500 [Mayamaea pseudoterrestris]|nr:hypothetical protein MPSEU_000130900 [Mayamaea pseudoterrestris]GKY91596.1 hypothetical protein MPSEU_000131500 [Mayamaea pseudoterrestris]
MKFDTKTLKPMPVSPEHCFVRPNKFVPPVDHETKDDDGDQGRQVYYEATIVYTPVYASTRIHQDQVSSGRKKLLEDLDMESLNQKLEGLFIGGGDDDKEAGVVKKRESKKDNVKTEMTKKEGLGRSAKAGHDKTAMRSRRALK